MNQNDRNLIQTWYSRLGLCIEKIEFSRTGTDIWLVNIDSGSKYIAPVPEIRNKSNFMNDCPENRQIIRTIVTKYLPGAYIRSFYGKPEQNSEICSLNARIFVPWIAIQKLNQNIRI